VSELLHRCLQKPLKARQRAIGDAAFQLHRAIEVGEATDSQVRQAMPAPRQRMSWRKWTAAATVCTAAGLLGWMLGTRSATPRAGAEPPAIRAAVSLPSGTTVSLSRGSAVALSPDGTHLVFAGRSGDEIRLYQRALDRFDSTAIPGTEGAANPFFSPDGRWVGFFSEGKLKKVALEGGAPIMVTDAGNPRGEAWGDADTILFTPRNSSAVSRVSAAGGQPSALTTLETGELSHRWPRLLPGNSAVLFTVWNDTGWEPARVVAQRLDGSGRNVVVERNGGYARYVRDGASARGYLVYARAEGLMAARFDESTLSATGVAVPVVDGIITNLSGGAHFDLAANGTLAYVPGAFGEANREVVWVNLDGTPGPPLQTSRLSTLEWRLSPDGRKLLHSNTGGTARELWIDDLERGTRVQLPQASDNFLPVWSGDGSWIAFIKGVQGGIVRTGAQSGAPVEMLLPNDGQPTPNSVSPDGRWLAYAVTGKGTQRDIWMLPVPAGPPGSGGVPGAARPFVQSVGTDADARFSPDGRWVVYQSNTTGRFEVYVRPFPEGDREYQISTDGGLDPDWSSSGREIYFHAPDSTVMAAPFASPDNGRPAPRKLFDGSRYENPLAASADGRRLLMVPRLTAEAAATEIRLVVNFLDELRARVR
jgi:serine/threonine-protein kinase